MPAAGGQVTLDVWVPCAYAPAMVEIEKLWAQEHPNVKLRKRVENVAVMPPRILEGATPDVFMSVGDVEVEPLEAANKVGYRQAFCFVEISLLTEKGNPHRIESLEDLASDRVETVGIGTENLSVGRYGREMLQKAGVWEAIKDKTVEAEEPVVLLRTSAKGKVDAALAYAACVKAEKGEVVEKLGKNLENIAFEIDEYCPIIPCPAVSISGCKEPELAQQFIDFLTTDPVQEILEDYGFTTLSEPKCF